MRGPPGARGPGREAHQVARVGVQGVADAGAGGVRRQPHHVVRHVGDDRGQRERARVGATRDQAAAVRRRRPPRPCRRRCGRRAAWRCRRGTARRTAGGRRRAAGARWPARPCPAATAGGSAAGTSGAPTRAPSQPPSWSSSACTASSVCRPSSTPERVGQPVAARGGRPSRATTSACGNGRGRPSQVTNVPDFSVGGATGQHDVGAVGHLGVPDLERDEERDRGRAPRGRWPGRAGPRARGRRRRAPPSSPARAAARISRGRAARLGRQVLDAPGGGEVDARRGVRDRATARQQRRQQAGLDGGPLAHAARDPGEPGAGALREPHGGGEAAGHAGQALADEHEGAGGAEQRRPSSAQRAGRCRCRRGPRPRCPGAAGSSVPDSRSRPRLASGGDREHPQLAASTTASRRRRNAMPASSSASRPTSSTAGARSRSANVTSSVRPATWWPRNVSSSAECGRARPSTSLVPSATRANLPYA